jgi:hypothetical protein
LLQTEGLETRNLLTGGAGNTFGLLTGSITAGDKPAVVKFTVDPTRFELPGRGAVLGIDVAASSNSSLGPEITFVKGRGLDPRRATTATNSDAILAPINARVRGGQVRTYEVTVTSANKTTGQFLVGLYLPGDVDGNGVVNRTDLTEFKKAMGAKVGSPKYDFDADSNRDGVINRMDQQYVMKNQPRSSDGFGSCGSCDGNPDRALFWGGHPGCNPDVRRGGEEDRQRDRDSGRGWQVLGLDPTRTG